MRVRPVPTRPVHTEEEYQVKVTKPLAVGAVVAAATGIAMPTLGASGNKYDASTVQHICKNSTTGATDGTVTLVGPLKLWPPNHKMIDEPVTAQSSGGSGTVTLTLTPVITDATGGDGGPQHDPDFNANDSNGETLTATGDGSATAGLQLRAERSGKGDGRTYTINWDVKWPNGDDCNSGQTGQAPFVVTVPHDMRGGADF
ncbi:MAG: hypothetical protein QOG34_1629 [Frankiaceae bacterium]|jgi:hypothetical protein|nr:hypothetical protein [Frankiaceae bacterium]